jgi:hypothetical protein
MLALLSEFWLRAGAFLTNAYSADAHLHFVWPLYCCAGCMKEQGTQSPALSYQDTKLPKQYVQPSAKHNSRNRQRPAMAFPPRPDRLRSCFPHGGKRGS